MHWAPGDGSRWRLIMVPPVVLTIAACTSAVPDNRIGAESFSQTPMTMRDDAYTVERWWDRVSPPTSCPVTKSTGAMPPPSIPSSSAPVPWSDSWYGNEALWTRLPKTGVIPAVQGSVKFPWWRVIDGTVKVTGTRLGSPGATLTASAPDGYGSTGFQPSALDFPDLGCWTITGTVSGKSLSITAWIQAQPN